MINFAFLNKRVERGRVMKSHQFKHYMNVQMFEKQRKRGMSAGRISKMGLNLSAEAL